MKKNNIEKWNKLFTTLKNFDSVAIVSNNIKELQEVFDDKETNVKIIEDPLHTGRISYNGVDKVFNIHLTTPELLKTVVNPISRINKAIVMDGIEITKELNKQLENKLQQYVSKVTYIDFK